MTQGANAAPTRGWYHGWNIIAVCILSQVAANGLTYNTYSLFLRDWSAQLHAPISQRRPEPAGSQASRRTKHPGQLATGNRRKIAAWARDLAAYGTE
jgi:hypothetical protein